MVPFSRLLAALNEIPDHRRAQGKRYPLPYLLLFTVLGLLSGARSYRGVIIFLTERRSILNQHFGTNLKRAPAVNTLRTVLQSLAAETLESTFRHYAKDLMHLLNTADRPVIALDGKTLRRSFDHLLDKKAAQVLSAFASEAAIVLAHTVIDDKSNEIPAAQQMIRDLGLTGVIFTADAMHCQKKTFEAAADTGNSLIAQIKGNQQALLDAAVEIAASKPAIATEETADKIRHGRQEHRRIEIFDASGHLPKEWDGLITTLARVSRLTWHKDTKSGYWISTEEVSWYGCQIRLGAAETGAAIRAHWGVENRNHYVRDVSFFEDLSRIRTLPAAFATMRTLALNILRANRVKNIASELYRNAVNPLHALKYLFG